MTADTKPGALPPNEVTRALPSGEVTRALPPNEGLRALPPDATLDATGLICPMPVLRTGRALRAIAPGKVLEVRATDRGAERDMAGFCATTGHELLAFRQEGAVLIFLIRKTGG